MPKRIGFLYEQVITEANCIAATKEMTKGKNNNKKAMRIRENAEMYGTMVANDLQSGTWRPLPYKEHTIRDGANKKQRHIKVPSLRDQAVHHAVMKITIPFILNRNYFYNCGSIPHAGTMRAVKAVKRWMKDGEPNKYCAQFDVRHFYETCPHWAVMDALRRIFKDEKFLALHEQILESMGDGLAIGYYPSQWYANLVLMSIDNKIKQHIYPDCHYVRYMDDMCLFSNNKRKLHKTRILVQDVMKCIGLGMKGNFQVVKIGKGFVRFLSYRFYRGHTLIKKNLMIRISRKIRQSGRNPSLHNALSVVSYMGLLKHCNSFKFKEKWIYPQIDLGKYKEVISRESNNGTSAIIHV